MPKSKRNRVVALTKTDAKGHEHKEEFLNNVREAAEQFSSIYVFRFENMRNIFLKDIRQKFSSSKFFIGKNKVMKIALGKTDQEELKPNTHKLAEQLTGNCGLFFTNESDEKVTKFFEEYSEMDFARCGFQATERFAVEAGPLPQFGHSIEPHLRKLGLPTSLKSGVIHCEYEYEVCQPGTVLTADQARILELFGIKMAEFKIELVCRWNNGEVTEL